MLIRAVLIWGMMALSAAASPEFWRHEWPNTDFSRTNVDSWIEILSGGPSRDGIPALSDPAFLRADTETRLDPRDPVLTLELPGEVPRAYPIRYLIWHEIVNDRVGDVPVAVTFCPLCNSGIIFDRRLDGRTFGFGVSGKLRNSDMIMYDHQTESWWQQAVGEGIVGQMTGASLTQLPAWMEGFGQFLDRNPQGLVMDEPDWSRAYGTNPYVGYDGSLRPFLYSGEMPPHDIPALARVVRVDNRAWPLDRLARIGDLSESGIRLTWAEGQASALDKGQIASGREVGSIRVRDAAGHDLPHDVMFAFAFHAFFPKGEWMLGK